METSAGEQDIINKTIEVKPTLYLKAQISEIAERSKSISNQAVLSMGATSMLGATIGVATHHETAAVLAGVVGVLSGGMILRSGLNAALDVYDYSLLDKSLPKVGSVVGTQELDAILTDPMQAVASNRVDNIGERGRVYSSVQYKSALVEEFAKNISSPEDVKYLWELIPRMPNHDLKIATINILSKYGSPFASAIYESSGLTEIQSSALSKFLLDWQIVKDPLEVKAAKDNADKLKLLSTEKILALSEDFSKKVEEKLKTELNFNERMIPLVKLFVLRNVRQKIIDNNELTFEDDFIDNLSDRLSKKLTRHNRDIKESAYFRESPTIGFEMQPIVSNRFPTSFKLDYSEIQKVVKYAGFKVSLDYPFEMSFPPTRTPILQLMMLGEVLQLTGTPIENAGIQINFGGLGTEGDRSKILALQRVIISMCGLQPPAEYFQKGGKFWEIGVRSGYKSEVSLRGAKSNEKVSITPPDEESKEFDFLSEIRAPMGAETFESFAKGVMYSHRIASLVKASEKLSSDKEYSNREQIMHDIWIDLSNKLNEVCKLNNLPPIDSEWSKEDWTNFANIVLTEGNAFSKETSTILSLVRSF